MTRQPQDPTDESLIPDEFKEDVENASQALERYQKGDRLALDQAVFAWNKILNTASLKNASKRFQFRALSEAGEIYMRLYLARREVANLSRSIELWQQAIQHTPPGSPERARSLDFLGGGLSERYARTRQVEDLGAAIAAWQQAVQSISPEAPVLPRILDNLGDGLREYYSRTGRLNDLYEAIQVFREAVQRIPEDSIDLPGSLIIIGIGLLDRYAHTSRLKDLEDAITVWRRALRHTPPGSPDRPAILNNLGNGLRERYARTGRFEDLEEAITVWRQALRRTPPGSTDHPAILNNLGLGLRNRYARTGQLEDLEEAITVWRQALRRTPPGSSDLPSRLTNLGIGLRYRYERTGRLEDLEEAITGWQQALQQTPPDSPDLPLILSNQGVGLHFRYSRTGRLEDLQEAIQAFRDAVQRIPEDSPDLPTIFNNLGNSLLGRYARTGRLEDLEEAISFWRQAVWRTPPESPALPRYLSSLGNGLRDRYERTSRLKDLEEAVRIYQQAVQRTPPDSPDLSGYLNNLGNGLIYQYMRSGNLEDLEGALTAWQRAVQLSPSDSPSLHEYLNNLGNGLSDHYEHTGRLEDLEEAIRNKREAIQRTPPDSPALSGYLNNLGHDLRDHYKRTSKQEDIQEGRKSFQSAIAIGRLLAPESGLRAATNWGDWALERSEWDEALNAYRQGLHIADLLYQNQFQQTNVELWMSVTLSLPSRAAFASAQINNLSRAVELLEENRARFLREVMERNRRDLERLPETGHADLYQNYLRVSDHWRDLLQLAGITSTFSPDQPGWKRPEGLLEQLEAAQTEIQAIVDSIRKVEGFEYFLHSLPVKSIQTLSREAPLLYLVVTPAGGLALLVQPHEITPIWLDGLTDSTLRKILHGPGDGAQTEGYLRAYSAWRRTAADEDASEEAIKTTTQAWLQAIDQTTRWLWETCMGDVVQALVERDIRRVALIPGGSLGLLPLHIAWSDDPSRPTRRRYALDQVCFTYAPSAYILWISRKFAGRPPERLLAVDNPDGSLLFSSEEVASVHDHFKARNPTWLIGEAASLEKVKASMEQVSVLHFATHGMAGFREPLEGFLLMAHDRRLKLRDIMELQLDKARLAVLSACETGIPGTKLPDEVVSLPMGFMQAGVPGVIGSLWAVNDASTMMLMARFYDLWRSEGMDPPEALRQAQIWLRDTTNTKKEIYFKKALPEYAGSRLAEATARASLRETLWKGKEERSFSHPFNWGAFSYSGV